MIPEEAPVRLLDFLEQYPGWTVDAEGRLWSVEEYVSQFRQLAGPADRGPEVIACPSIDAGALMLVALDATGRELEPVGRLFPTARR